MCRRAVAGTAVQLYSCSYITHELVYDLNMYQVYSMVIPHANTAVTQLQIQYCCTRYRYLCRRSYGAVSDVRTTLSTVWSSRCRVRPSWAHHDRFGLLPCLPGILNITWGLRRPPGRPPVAAGSREAQNVSSLVAKDGDQTKCQEVRMLCTLRRRMRARLLQLYWYVSSVT